MTFQRFATVLLFLAIATAACLMPAQSDTFWQLRAGQEMAASGNVMLHDAFTYSVRGGFWPNHEWLSEVLFYGLWRVGGMPALAAFAASMALLAWAFVWRVMTGPALWRGALILLVLIPSAKLWSVRPQVISLALLAALLVLVTRERWRLVPMLFIAWANLHGGVMLGVIALTGALAARVAAARSPWKPAALVLASSVAAVCLTPLGVTIWVEVPHMLGRLRSYGVTEWRAVDAADPFNIPFFIVAAALAACALRRWHHLDRSQAALLGAAAALFAPALESDRNVAPFLIAAVAALSRMAPEVASRLERFETSVRHPRHTVLAMAAAAGCLALVARTWTRPPERMNWSPLPADVAAAVEGCQGNLYNQYDNGGYLIWFAPRKPVFIDSRQDPFPPELVLAHRSVEMTGNYTALFDRFQVECVALPPVSPTAMALKRAGWRILVEDRAWLVLTHAKS
jgi:hypothetical protein